MEVTGLRQYFFFYRRTATGLTVPISTSYPDANPWRTVPWDTLVEDPGEQNPPGTVSLNNGWTFLYGPCYFSIDASVGMSNVTPRASTHLQFYSTSITNSDVPQYAWEGWEQAVLDLEGNTAHFVTSAHGFLPPDQRLRLRADWWHPADPDEEPLIDRARVQGFYRRVPS